MSSPKDRRKSWVAVACSDGAVRLVDTSPQRAASVVRTSYAHGVEATAVAISHEGRCGKNNGEDVWKVGYLIFFISKVFEYIEVGLLNGSMEGFV